MNTTIQRKNKSPLSQNKTLLAIRRDWQLYLMLLLPIAFFIIFKYVPMYGAQIAFRRYRGVDGILGSKWVGWYYFEKFFKSRNFGSIMWNTVSISVYNLLASFPIPIILALALHACIRPRFKKLVQNFIYVPHFISLVVLCGLILQFLDPKFGIINVLLTKLGLEPVAFMASPKLFDDVFVWSGIWQNAGWGTIIYLAALMEVDPAFHEAAQIDGATRLQRILHVDLPCIMPTAITMLILNCGRIFNVGYQKILLLQNSMNQSASEVVQTYSYKIGLASQMADFSYSTAIGLFVSVCNFVLIIIVNQAARKFSDSSIW